MFFKEKDMTNIVIDWLSPQFDVVVTELGCGYCSEFIPDIVAASFDEAKIKKITRYTPYSRGSIQHRIDIGKPFELFHTDLVAVELKLKNFAQAYFQAKMYQMHGMRTYIAMPEDVIMSISSRRFIVAKNDGIGLIKVLKDKCHITLEAQEVKENYVEQLQITERIRPKLMA